MSHLKMRGTPAQHSLVIISFENLTIFRVKMFNLRRYSVYWICTFNIGHVMTTDDDDCLSNFGLCTIMQFMYLYLIRSSCNFLVYMRWLHSNNRHWRTYCLCKLCIQYNTIHANSMKNQFSKTNALPGERASECWINEKQHFVYFHNVSYFRPPASLTLRVECASCHSHWISMISQHIQIRCHHKMHIVSVLKQNACRCQPCQCWIHTINVWHIHLVRNKQILESQCVLFTNESRHSLKSLCVCVRLKTVKFDFNMSTSDVSIEHWTCHVWIAMKMYMKSRQINWIGSMNGGYFL